MTTTAGNARRNRTRTTAFMNDPKMHRQVLDHLAIGVFTVDKEYRITGFNRQAEELTGFSRDQAVGRLCYEILRADVCFSDCPLRRAMGGEERNVRCRVKMIAKNNEELPVEVTAAVLRDEHGQAIGGVETFQDDRERVFLEKKVLDSYALEDIVGRSKPILSLMENLPLLARAGVNVLVLGETGAGKGLIARAIHNLSPRRDGPFVTINCAAIPENLLESELFGFKKGAFTNAHRDYPGRLAGANQGSIFLDEIGDMPLALQGKLLQVIEDKEFHPLGSNRPVKVDVRLIAATNRNLEQMVLEGDFRSDLYYRLNVAVLDAPPLRERREDIPLLVDHFLIELNSLGDIHITGAAQEAMAALMRHDYPGNVRELKNILEYAAAIRRHGDLRLDDLPRPFQERQTTPSCDSPSLPSEADELSQAQQMERDRVLRALERTEGSRTKAAAELGISRSTLWRRMKRLGLHLRFGH